ncbi:sensor histidine kinase [Paraclostridium bifermentans]|uniref:sensor histidine kinase n=1 Tax=Paraclostridium bifermentans TaxID=1490 RepID=UPI00359C452B
MFEAFLYKFNDRYKVFDEEDLKIRLSLSKPLLVQKVWYYILLTIFFIMSYRFYYGYYNYYYYSLLKVMTVIEWGIYLALAISTITVLMRSVYWYRLNVKKDEDSENSIYTKIIIKKWIALILHIALVFGYIGSVRDGDMLLTKVFIGVLIINILRLILKIAGNKMSLSIIKENLIMAMENVDKREGRLEYIKNHLGIDKDIEVFFGARCVYITNRLKLALLKVEESTLKEKLSISNKSQLITNLSHDLKTPLTSIINSTYILKTEKLNDEEVLEQIDILKNKTNRLNSLIDNMNDVINSDEEDVVLNTENINIVYLLKDTIENFKDRLGESNLHLRVNIQNEDIIMNLDKDKTTRIFENLLDNIIKYSLEDTRVYIDLWQKEDDIEISFKNISKYDIDTNEDMLTNRFVKGDKSRNSEGYGLGLSIVNNLVKVQGGKVKVEVEGDLFKALITFKALNNNIV